MTQASGRAATATGSSTEAPPSGPGAFPVVGIGASAGGLEAFQELLAALPPETGMAFVLVQHLDPSHPSYLSDALAKVTSLPVAEIRDGMAVEPDHVYVTPPGADLGILDGVLALLPRSAEAHRRRLSIDFFFRALAQDRGDRAIGVVLSGTGADGADGLRAIKAEGGVTFAQDPGSAGFRGMPEAALGTGAVDVVLPIPQLAQELLRIGRHPFLRRGEGELLAGEGDDQELKKVLLLLRNAAGIAFHEYKLTSIRRRVARRMAVRRMTSLPDYVLLLKEDRAEAEALLGDLLIHVTSFFRDREAFERLEEVVLPRILEQKRDGGTIRVWCAGCSTGEEAYSIVISLLELLAREDASHVPVQLFGTDVSERAIEKARAGLYPETVTRDVGADRLARFFTRVEGGGYRIVQAVRERCTFVKHNLASDPPFSKLDLVSCRNVLIYFGPELQRRALAAFHFALSEPGFLLLGHAEHLGDGAALFSAVDRSHKIFARLPGRSALRFAPARDLAPSAPRAADARARAAAPRDVVRRAESVLLDHYAPPGVIVDERMEILHFRGRTGPYLEPAPGQPGHDLLKMARPGLMADLRVAISQATKGTAVVRRRGVQVQLDEAQRLCDLVVIPGVAPPESSEQVFAVLFEEVKPPGAQPERAAALAPAAAQDGSADERLAAVEHELETTRAYLQSIIEDHRRTNDDLMSSNEELVSSNEELQSLNEELETAREELQSSNEELATLNQEMLTRNAQLNQANSDLVNILASAEVPIVIVDGGRRIRRFTPRARPLLNLLPSDVGRPIDDIKPALAIDDLGPKIAEVIESVTMHEEEVAGRDGRWYQLQIRPYTTMDRRIDGAVLSVIDIDALRRALGAAEWARDYARAAVEAIQIPLLVLDGDLAVRSANEAFSDGYGHLAPELVGQSVYAIMDRVWDFPELRSALDRALAGERFQRLEVERDLPRIGVRAVSLSGRSVQAPTGGRTVVLAVEDVTEHRRAELERARLLEDARLARASADEANRAKDQFLATLSHELRTPLATLLMQAQLLRIAPLDEERLRRSAEAIERASLAQAQLIDDLLDISRIVTGKLKMELQAVDLAAVIRTAVETVAAAAAAKQVAIELDLEDGLVVTGDAGRLRQVIWNLLINAIKFTPSGGRVAVTLDVAMDRGRIRVSDTGCGIEPEFLHHVFDRFTQEDRTQARSQGGLGLGLAISRHLVEAHGGTIHAESAGEGQGATFTVLLPRIAERAELAPTPAPAPPRSIERARVLIVEDDPDTREVLTDMLRMCGAEVHTVESAGRAMQIFEQLRPELLVCDIAMPDQDGYDLIGKLRALGPGRGGDVPALALTALATDEDRRRAFAAGFQGHMAKPVDIGRLRDELAELLSRAAR